MKRVMRKKAMVCYFIESTVCIALMASDPKQRVSTTLRCRVQMAETLAKVAIELGDLAPSYFNNLYSLFITAATDQDSLVVSSALCGLANLIMACRGRFFSKNIQEVRMKRVHVP